jgi:hypothetical protein
MEKIGKKQTDPGSTPGASTDVSAGNDRAAGRAARPRAARVATASQDLTVAEALDRAARMATSTAGRAARIEAAAREALRLLIDARAAEPAPDLTDGSIGPRALFREGYYDAAVDAVVEVLRAALGGGS